MKYIAVVGGGRATIHTNVCSQAVVESMALGMSLIPVHKIDEASIAIELLRRMGQIPEIRYHGCCHTMHEDRRWVLDIGAVVVESKGQRFVVCDACGVLSPSDKAACISCGLNLWTVRRGSLVTKRRATIRDRRLNVPEYEEVSGENG
jgi:hypothetical protein